MESKEIIDDVNIALAFIKKGEILLTSDGKNKTYFVLKKDKIHCQSQEATFSLSFNQFLSIYEKSKFVIYTFSEGTEIDLKKDEEYYSWDVLSK